jgi:two-component system, cell cycle sensor histidine kinase and response regulator CckA
MKQFRVSGASTQYGLAILAVGAAILLRLALDPILRDTLPFITFVAAVAVTAWYGGLKPGLVATALSALAGCCLIMAPWFGLQAVQTGDWPRLLIATLFGVLVSALIGNVRRTYLELRKSEQKYQDLYDNAPEMMLSADMTTGKVVECNLTMARKTGYSKDEIIGRPIVELYLPECLDRVRGTIRDFKEKGELHDVEYKVQCKDGSALDVILTVSALRDETGRVVRGRAVWQDITARKRAELALRESEQRYRTVADFTYSWEYWRSPEGKLLYLSPSCQRISGYAAERFQNHPEFMLSILHPDDRAIYERHYHRSLAQHEPEELEFRIIHRDGRVRWISHVCQDVVDSDGKWLGRRASNRDITEQKRSAEEREKLQQQLAQAQKIESVGRLAGGLAHDFNNLMTVIEMYCSALLDELDPQGDMWSSVEEIRKAQNSASHLAKQLLAFSREEVFEPKALDLNDVVDRSVQMLEQLIGENIELVSELDADLGRVMADPLQIQQVVVNLIVNARDAMPKGGRVVIRTQNFEVDGTSSQSDANVTPVRYVRLSITDTGIGMSAETRLKVFEPFFTTKEVGKGTGLGLATAYGIIQQSGGWIDVWSEVDRGSSFTIHLPRIDATPLAIEERPVTTKALRGWETVLIVEDQEGVRKATRAALSGYGYQVLDAANGLEAVAAAQEHAGEIHLLLTDVVLPGMNGKQVAERLRPLRPDLKVLFMSAYSASLIAQHGVLEAGVAYISKPFDRDRLAAKVREVLNRPIPIA